MLDIGYQLYVPKSGQGGLCSIIPVPWPVGLVEATNYGRHVL